MHCYGIALNGFQRPVITCWVQVLGSYLHYLVGAFLTGNHGFRVRLRALLQFSIVACVTSPTKKMPFLETNPRLEAPVPFDVFLVRHCRISAKTPATPSILKPTTRRRTLRCFHYGVAKRHHFSCRLRTATLSLEFAIWFQRVGVDLSRAAAKL